MPQSGNPRNVEIFAMKQQQQELVAGFMQLGHTTVRDLYACLEICFYQPRPGQFRLCTLNGSILSRETRDHIVPIANYFVISLSDPWIYLPVELVVETAWTRGRSRSTPNTPGGSIPVFKNRVRTRDQVCVISGLQMTGFTGLQAAHIIPRSQIQRWVSGRMSAHLLEPLDPTIWEGYNRIDSVQNGLLLNSLLHDYWDSWLVSINPWTYRVFFFVNDHHYQPLYDGKLVQFNSTPENPAPAQPLLYEHFKQAVLANMKGAGKPPELEFDPTDDAQSMSTFEGGEGKDWFETRMLMKLAHLQEQSHDAETVVGEEHAGD